jgi:alpha-mannosidase
VSEEPHVETSTPETVHLVVVPHTHWDREWYQPFQEFRARLVPTVDALLDTLDADPAFRHFHLDGQTIVLEDYLEIRPEARPRLERLIRSGRIAVGPWYVLPDLLLPSGESLIRNLAIGAKLARRFGASPSIGYLPDQFGHTAQLPQLLRGFGFEAALVWRGVGADVVQTEFSWEALDGTAIFTVYLPHGYMNGFGLVDEPQAMRWRLEGIVSGMAPFRRSRTVLVMNGMDHHAAERGLPGALAEAIAGVEGVTVEIGSLASYVGRARAEAGSMPTHRGELRSALRAHLLPGVTSVRVRQKQRDFAVTGALEHYAEPLAVWADAHAGRRDLAPFTEWAWKLAVQNHAHDSICGCSIDRVHADVDHRLDQVDLVVGDVTRRALATLAAATDTRAAAADAGALVVFNPCAAGTAIVEAPADDTTAGIVDAGGSPLPVDRLPDGALRFAAPLAGHGITVFGRSRTSPTVPPPPFHATASTLEGRWYRLAVNDDGSVCITDRTLGLELGRANRFVDEGDRGDEYNFDPVPDAAPIAVPAAAPVVRVSMGAVSASLEVTLTYRLPQALAADRKARAAETVDVPIRTTLTLHDAVRRVDVTTEVDNRACDHRLRVHFDTPLATDAVHVEQAFGVVERSFTLEPPGGLEEPVGTGPQKTFAFVSDGQAGVALLNRGIPEIEARRTAGGTELVLTLIRAVGWLSREDLRSRLMEAGPKLETPGAQSLGPHRFEYALTTWAGQGDGGDLVAEAHRFAWPALATPTDRHDGPLGPEPAMVRIDNPRIVLSAVAPGRTPDRQQVRCWNASGHAEAAAFVFPGASRARPVDLRGRPVAARVERRGGVLRATFRPYEILTLEVVRPPASP